jgi:sporulation protein YlmC with PRC-barrel domain
MTHSTTMPISGQASVQPASSIKGTKVQNPKGERLGMIEDLMLHADSGDVAYAVLSFGGFLGMGEKLFAVPWEALTIDADHGIILNVDRERLEQAPGFGKNDRPSTADATWMQELHRYYGFEYVSRPRR